MDTYSTAEQIKGPFFLLEIIYQSNRYMLTFNKSKQHIFLSEITARAMDTCITIQQVKEALFSFRNHLPEQSIHKNYFTTEQVKEAPFFF